MGKGSFSSAARSPSRSTFPAAAAGMLDGDEVLLGLRLSLQNREDA